MADVAVGQPAAVIDFYIDRARPREVVARSEHQEEHMAIARTSRSTIMGMKASI